MNSHDHQTRSSWRPSLSLTTAVKNARYEAVCGYVSKIIDGGEWRDYTVPNGTRYQFRAQEFDWFLAANDLDVDMIRHATAKHGGHARLMQLADLTGTGSTPKTRRTPAEMVADYPGETWAKHTPESPISQQMGRIAKDPGRRAAFEANGTTQDDVLGYQRIHARGKTLEELVDSLIDKIIKAPGLEAAVYRKLDSRRRRPDTKEEKRRSEATNNTTLAR